MKVLVYSVGQDTGGQGFRIREAMRKHQPDIAVDALAISPKYMAYPEQFTGRVYDRQQRAKALYDAADVVHLRLTLAGWDQLDRGQCKPIVLHHHGTIFRIGHLALSHRARKMGAVQVASTIDLTLLEPGVHWLPSPFDLGALAEIRAAEYVASDRIRIAHAPTNRNAKHTTLFEATCKNLARDLPIDVDVIEGATWAETLRRKARADIVYDQLMLGYGNNSVESWGMSVPVVAGVRDPKVRTAMVERWGRLPFAEATEATLEPVLRRMVESAAMRREYAEIGHAHAQRWHSERHVSTLLAGLYASAPRTVPVGRPLPVTGRERRAAMAQAAAL